MRDLLVAILQMFLEIVDLQAGRVVAQVTSAVPLTEAQKTNLSQQLSNYSGAEVRLELSEDADDSRRHRCALRGYRV